MDNFEAPVITDPLTGEDIGGDFSDITILSIGGDLFQYSLPDGREITSDSEGNIIEIE